MNQRNNVACLFDYWLKKLRLVPDWDVALQWVEDPLGTKTSDIKIDCTDKKAIVLLNAVRPKQENLEEVLVHELMHLKLYPQVKVSQKMEINSSGILVIF